MIDKIFFYGTLKDKVVIMAVGNVVPENEEDATISGRLYRIPYGYPMLLDNDLKDAYTVYGKLFTIEKLAENPAIFDECEGCNNNAPDSLYFRKKKQVNTKNGEKTAWVYVGNPHHEIARKHCVPENLIRSGEWKGT